MRPETHGASPARVDVLGVPVSAVDMSEALSAIDGWIRTNASQYVCVTGVHGVMESRRDAALRAIHAQAGMVTPDGMPLVWLSRAAGHRHVTRVYGPDLLLACCAAGVPRGYRHYFYGGGPGIAAQLADRLTRQVPGLQVAGVYSPRFGTLTPAEDAAACARIDAAAPDIVWVGLGTPRQERWMAGHVGRLRAPVLIGVGAAFDFHAGVKAQAPRWMQRSGLEWLFRLASEPRRLGPRYLVNNPAFVWALAREWARRERPRGTAVH